MLILFFPQVIIEGGGNEGSFLSRTRAQAWEIPSRFRPVIAMVMVQIDEVDIDGLPSLRLEFLPSLDLDLPFTVVLYSLVSD